MGLDYQPVTALGGESFTLYLIPQFTMPPIMPAGPFYFYAAMFDAGYLDLDHLASNGSSWEFNFE
jgi:hypothetical protein